MAILIYFSSSPMGVNVVVRQFKPQDMGLRGIWLIRPPALPHYHHLGELSCPSQASLSKVAANKGQKQLSCYHTLSAVSFVPLPSKPDLLCCPDFFFSFSSLRISKIQLLYFLPLSVSISDYACVSILQISQFTYN